MGDTSHLRALCCHSTHVGRNLKNCTGTAPPVCRHCYKNNVLLKVLVTFVT